MTASPISGSIARRISTVLALASLLLGVGNQAMAQQHAHYSGAVAHPSRPRHPVPPMVVKPGTRPAPVRPANPAPKKPQ